MMTNAGYELQKKIKNFNNLLKIYVISSLSKIELI